MYPKIQKYFLQKKYLYEAITSFLENSQYFDFNYFIRSKKEEFKKILDILACISNYHHKTAEFSSKIKQILLNYREHIKSTFSNSELLNIFKSSKEILLFLLESRLITIEDLYDQFQYNEMCHFFFPEIRDKIHDQKVEELELELSENILPGFNEKRRIGENDSYICQLIRQDSIKEFVFYVNNANICLSSKIEPSIFETNLFLIENEPTLIEYAAFFGSIKIFNYLRMRNVDLKSSLWIYSIHSNKIQMIHLLEDLEVPAPDNSYVACLIEAIKCHHNEIALYIENNLINERNSSLIDEIFDCSLRYSNYSFLPLDIADEFMFFYYCKYNCTDIVDIYLQKKEEEMEEFIIFIKKNVFF